MKKQWNIIKKLKFVNDNVFDEAFSFGEIENQLLHITDANFNYKDYFIQIYPDQNKKSEICFRVYVKNLYTDKEVSDTVFKSVEELVMNFKLPDGLPFIDFMMTPAEQFK